jgi:DeoR/GlpR family transcriptional regulator of sugar metabolism
MNEPRSRFPHERHQQMIDLIVELKRVGTTELASMMGISLPTVRRDVAVLEQAGLVSRTHGGVVARGIGESTTEPLFLEKLRAHQNLKTRIGAAAAATVDNNKVVILDSGTTSLAIARELAGRPVTVVAMDLKVAEAAASGATEVHVLGGRIRNGYYSIVGSWMTDALKDIRADVFFMSADAIDETGVTNSTLDEAVAKRAALDQAARTTLVADHSKLNRRSFTPVCPLNAVSLFITDRAAGPLLGPYRDNFTSIQIV